MDNYFDTAERMRDSARLLHEQKQFFNACYLAGYVYECYGKSLMQLIGYPVAGSHDLGAFAKNLHFILTTNPTAALLHRYFLTLPTDCPTIHGGACKWYPGKRYDPTYAWTELTSKAYQIEMETCFDKLVEMHIDGIITP